MALARRVPLVVSMVVVLSVGTFGDELRRGLSMICGFPAERREAFARQDRADSALKETAKVKPSKRPEGDDNIWSDRLAAGLLIARTLAVLAVDKLP